MPDSSWWDNVAHEPPGGEDRQARRSVGLVTDEELREIETEARAFLIPGGRGEPETLFQVTASQRLIARVVFSMARELRRLRSDDWIDLAADGIARDPTSLDAPDQIADVIRGHFEAARRGRPNE